MATCNGIGRVEAAPVSPGDPVRRLVVIHTSMSLYPLLKSEYVELAQSPSDYNAQCCDGVMAV